MFEKRANALKAAKSFTEEQLDFARRAYEAVLECWNIGIEDEETARAFHEEAECKADFAAEAAEYGIFDTYEEFIEALSTVENMDERSMAYC